MVTEKVRIEGVDDLEKYIERIFERLDILDEHIKLLTTEVRGGYIITTTAPTYSSPVIANPSASVSTGDPWYVK